MAEPEVTIVAPPTPAKVVKTNVAAFARHVLTAAGGALVAGGVMTSGQLNGCVTEFVHGLSKTVEEGGGGLIVALGLGWSFWQKFSSAQDTTK